MFAQLVASRPARHRTPEGITVSLALHATVITMAIVATGAKDEIITFVSPPKAIVYVAAPPPATPTASARPMPPVIDQAPRIPVVAPTEIPTEIPAADASTIVTPLDPFPSPGPVGPAAGVPGGAPNGAPNGAPGGLASGDSAYTGDQVEVAASRERRSPLPRFPDVLRAQRTEGSVRIRFVVDTLGRVEMETVEVIESTHSAFTLAARSTLPRMRFRPARIGKARVRQLVEVPIMFTLER